MSTSPRHSRKRRIHKSEIATTGSRRRTLSFVLHSVRDTARLGHVIGKALRGGEVIGLCGPLGSGKTTMVRGVAGGLHATPTSVTSPTFVLMHEYRGRLLLIHADLYRLASEADVRTIGLEEHFNETTVTAIEWADRFAAGLPPDRLDIRLEHRTPCTRRIFLMATGPMSVDLLMAVRRGYRNVRSTGGGNRKHVQSASSRRTPT